LEQRRELGLRHLQKCGCLVGSQPSKLCEPMNPNRESGLSEFDVGLWNA
jgi:hypothetical protein